MCVVYCASVTPDATPGSGAAHAVLVVGVVYVALFVTTNVLKKPWLGTAFTTIFTLAWHPTS